jgi:hypothetical protein
VRDINGLKELEISRRSFASAILRTIPACWPPARD